MPAKSVEVTYEEIARRYGGRPTAAGARRFGSDALKVNGKIFAFMKEEGLVLKLPASRIDALVQQKIGRRFDRGRGVPLKEWIVLAPGHRSKWQALADEAHAFVKGAAK